MLGFPDLQAINDIAEQLGSAEAAFAHANSTFKPANGSMANLAKPLNMIGDRRSRRATALGFHFIVELEENEIDWVARIYTSGQVLDTATGSHAMVYNAHSEADAEQFCNKMWQSLLKQHLERVC
jgi:hypothetical protein